MGRRKKHDYEVDCEKNEVGLWVQNILNQFTEILEFLINIIVLVAIVIALISLWEPMLQFIQHRTVEHSLMKFIERVFDVVIAIEFKKMLGKPDTSTIMEILVFVIVRHMIITDTSAMENFLTIVSVGAIFAIKKYLHEEDEKQIQKKQSSSGTKNKQKKKSEKSDDENTNAKKTGNNSSPNELRKTNNSAKKINSNNSTKKSNNKNNKTKKASSK